jgi:hypothetical protein
MSDKKKQNEEEKKAIKLIKWLIKNGFTDTVDENPLNDFHRFGNVLLRNPKTGCVVYIKPDFNSGYLYDYTKVYSDEVIDNLRDVEDGFFEVFWGTRKERMNEVRENPDCLAEIILVLNYYCWLYDRYCDFRETPETIMRAVKEMQKNFVSNKMIKLHN